MRKTLLRQVYPTYFATVVVCIVALALVATALVRSFVYDTARLELEDMISVTEKIFFLPSAPRLREDADQEIERLFEGLNIRLTVVAPDGTVLADSMATAATLEKHDDRPEIAEALSRGTGSATRQSQSIGNELLYLAKSIVRDGRPVAVVRASMPLPFLREKLAAFYAQLALGGIIILAAAAALAFASVKRINRPLTTLGEAARRFGSGDLNYRSRVSEPEEIEVLSNTMNSMAAELRSRMDDVERRRREAEAILAGLREGVIVLDRELRVVRTNEAATRLIAPTEGDNAGKTLLETFRSTELQRMAKEALAAGKAVEGSLTFYSDTPRYLQVYAAEIPGREGGGCLLVLHDVTRLMQLENIRKDFVANVSHELKTPITSIKGFVETLADGALEDPVQARRFLEIIAKHADRLEDIIEDLLALARLEQQEGKPLETEILPLPLVLEDVSTVCRMKAAEKRIAVIVDCPPDLTVSASRTLLEQAFVNLLDNAIKYSGEGTEVRILARKEGEDIVAQVIDQGRGIPAKDLSRIFERFYRVDKGRSRDAGGTGLGLAIVKHVMGVHGGSVSAESWEGAGSTFTLRFPSDAGKSRTGPLERRA
jgi:two-component system phosphate regulon sensor histidine kinase PhoR